ncbi:MAG: hypothetical protein DRJ42_17685 [Deltaproteobacteria bacterium]|nr:MAG: hypothetical protein DRJ42_17685 [Deltaproteobacteria bacterium]
MSHVYGSNFIVRPPVPTTVNKAGANYKSEVTHLEYSPREAYDEWLAICDAIVACGGDALFEYEALDDPFLDHEALRVGADGSIYAGDSTEVLGNLADAMTGRVFTANGPWVSVRDGALRAVMPNMLAHRRLEADYYRRLVSALGDAAGLTVEVADNPHRWEGMADVAVVGDNVVLTYAVAGHYDEGTTPKSARSSKEGVAFAADFTGVDESARVYAELVYPHFHGDTVHFGARPAGGAPVLVHYAGGLWGPGADIVREALGEVLSIETDDAVERYAGNSRQVQSGVLVPDGVSENFIGAMEGLGLAVHRVPLFELFGKAGGGPACATLYLPDNLDVPQDFAMRYSRRRDEARTRRERIPERLIVDRGYFEGRARG